MFTLTIAGLDTPAILATPADVRHALENTSHGLTDEERRNIDALMHHVDVMEPSESIAHHYAARALGVAIARDILPTPADVSGFITDLNEAFSDIERATLKREARRYIRAAGISPTGWKLENIIDYVNNTYSGGWNHFSADKWNAV
jgi:hypothetical protein